MRRFRSVSRPPIVLVPLLAPFLAAVLAVWLAAGPSVLWAEQVRPPAAGPELNIGLAAQVTSLDPHFHNFGPNNALAAHFFDGLSRVGADLGIAPGLAVGWTAIDATNWRFSLRPGVRFHDGSPLTAADVIASIERARAVTGSPSSFRKTLRNVVAMRADDPLTLTVTTRVPQTTLPGDLAVVAVVPASLADAPRSAFDDGSAVIGTGPFRLAGSPGGGVIRLERNDAYWDTPAHWRSVELRLIADDARRIAAAVAGEVGLIEQVPAADLSRLRDSDILHTVSGVSAWLLYLAFDQHRTVSPFVTDASGAPLDQNPFRDGRVRRAVSLAVDQEHLGRVVMEGQAKPAGQIPIAGQKGYSERLATPAHSLRLARALLRDAGYPDGFSVVLHVPRDRYPGALRIAGAVASMLGRIGIICQTETLPPAAFFAQAADRRFSLYISGVGMNTARSGNVLRDMIGEYRPDDGWGVLNRSGYRDARVDRLLEEALTTFDPERSDLLLRRASELAMGQAAIVPLVHPHASWAMRAPMRYTARMDQHTLAYHVRPR